MAAKGITYLGGRIDAGYRGEILVCLMNVNQPISSLKTERHADGSLASVQLVQTDVSVKIRKGDRIIQMSPFKADTDRVIEVVESLGESARDSRGFGSTGA